MDKPCLWARAARTGKAERGGRVSAGLKMAPALVEEFWRLLLTFFSF